VVVVEATVSLVVVVVAVLPVLLFWADEVLVVFVVEVLVFLGIVDVLAGFVFVTVAAGGGTTGAETEGVIAAVSAMVLFLYVVESGTPTTSLVVSVLSPLLQAAKNNTTANANKIFLMVVVFKIVKIFKSINVFLYCS
jgi:hypothetical protein